MFLIKGHPFPPFSSGLSFIERERGPGRRPKAKQSEPKRRHNRRSGQTSPLILFPSASEQEKATGASSYPMNPTPGTSEGSSRTSAAHGRAQSAGADRWPGDLLSFREMGRTWAERLVDDFFFFSLLVLSLLRLRPGGRSAWTAGRIAAPHASDQIRGMKEDITSPKYSLNIVAAFPRCAL